MTPKFSIVCPIKDEVNLIQKTLPSFYAIGPSEVILCLDKPAQKQVVEIIKKVAKICNAENITRIIEVEKNPEYAFHQAWVRRKGFLAAKNDLILTTDIDIIINPRIKEHFNLIKDDIKLISFSKFSYPITVRTAMAWLIQKFYYHESFTGLYVFSKSAWLETEDFNSLKKIRRGEDTHLHECLIKKYRSMFISGIKNINIRPKESKQYQFRMGWNRWRIRKTPLWRVILSTFLYFRPQMLSGYLKARLLLG